MSFLDGIKKKAIEAELRRRATASVELDVKEYGLKITITTTDVEQLVKKLLEVYEGNRGH